MNAVEVAEFNEVLARIAELEEALRFKRNVIISDERVAGFRGDWIAIPREDFEHARKVLDHEQ